MGVKCRCRHAWCKRIVGRIFILTALASWHHSPSRYKRFHPPYWATCETRRGSAVKQAMCREIKQHDFGWQFTWVYKEAVSVALTACCCVNNCARRRLDKLRPNESSLHVLALQIASKVSRHLVNLVKAYQLYCDWSAHLLGSEVLVLSHLLQRYEHNIKAVKLNRSCSRGVDLGQSCWEFDSTEGHRTIFVCH